MRMLPTMLSYTIDYRLGEFRRAIPHEEVTFIPFESDEGRALLRKVEQDPSLHITVEAGCPWMWVCVCGNRPTEEGFVPCNRMGEAVAEAVEGWLYPLYLCDRCRRIIDGDTLAVVSLAA